MYRIHCGASRRDWIIFLEAVRNTAPTVPSNNCARYDAPLAPVRGFSVHFPAFAVRSTVAHGLSGLIPERAHPNAPSRRRASRTVKPPTGVR